ncbi:hypothetical protein DNI29_22310 [Hymenobacter sediminis]|uniref:hypothetical protein n=1 Tax=Hymenobacter sediminis TaxID=2218621 RepID=UPI000DA6774F|nr:hypothetical protein [Hymenobacter sediminis]RPD44132.1 hypothetical protein DNI29_22310 [Hymenobacter sediminis]
MTRLTKEQLQRTLVDVRAAYRLLYYYQDRVLGTVQYIVDRLGLSYAGGWSSFSNVAPRNGKGSLDNWAWDWLNMYHYEFHLGSREIDGHRIAVSVILQSDTGFYDQPTAEPTNPATFASVEASVTRLQFMIGRDLWHPAVAAEYAKTRSKACDDYVILEGQMDGKSGTLIVKSFLLEEFVDEITIRERLIEVTNYCNTHGIPELALASSTGM